MASSNRQFVVYTCITGGYDSLREVKFVSPNVDYLCFTDNPSLTSKTWKILPIPDELRNDASLSAVKKQRLLKILAHKFLPSQYVASLWVDSNIEIIGDLTSFFQKYDLSSKFLYVNKHPSRDCIYREQLAVLRLKRDTFENTNPQINRYHDEGYPEHAGLAETNIMLRLHNSPKCVKLIELWASEVRNGSHRDQLSFNYCVWKAGLQDKVAYLDEKYFNLHLTDNAYFKLSRHVRVKTNAAEVDVSKQTVAVVEEKEKPKPPGAELAVPSAQPRQAKPISPSMPILSVVIFTHNRTNVAKETIRSLFKNLKYSGKIKWILSDDRSDREHLLELEAFFSDNGVPYDLVQTTSERWGLGASMNNGLQKAFGYSDFALRVEDDWILERELDADRLVKTMLNSPSVGMVRLGMIGAGVVCDEKRFPDKWYKTLFGRSDQAWLFNNQVALVHKNVHKAMGYYLENVDADKSEEEFRLRYNKNTNAGRKNFLVIAPKEMKPNTLDDPSLWFIHVGRSTLGHAVYREPKRYGWVYDEKKEIDKPLVELEKKTIVEKSDKALSDVKKTNRQEFSWPTISVMMVTHNRTAVAKYCLESLIQKLRYSGKIQWIVCDDRSEPGHCEVLKGAFEKYQITNYSILKTNSSRWGLGASMNNGLREAWKYGDVVFTTEDDWYLRNTYRIDDKVKLLIEDKDVAGIRIGALCNELGCGLKIDSIHKEYCKLEAQRNKTGRFYIFNNQVMIRHKRIFDRLGYMKENCSPDEQEKAIVESYNKLTDYGRSNTFKTLWPKSYDVATLYGKHNPFFHIGRSTISGKNRLIKKDFTYLNSDKLDNELRFGAAKNMTHTFFFKVVIPSYNVEKYIARCIESVEKQTFKNYHIVVVDDMSTDKTREILTDLSQRHKNITLRFLNKKSCAGGARNAAINAEPISWYTIFLDADDYFIDNTAFQQIYDCIKKHNDPDCVELSYERELKNGKTAKVIAKAKSVSDLLTQRVFAPWRKVVKSSILREFKPDRLVANDVIWTFRQADVTKTVAKIEKPLIHYSTSNPISGWNGQKRNKAELDKAIELLRKDLEEERYLNTIVDSYRLKELTLIKKKEGIYSK